MAIITWTLLVENALLPEGAIVPHLLWDMYFLFCYPKQEEGCAKAAGEKGAIYPKTWCKYIWPMVYAHSDIESKVVSFLNLNQNLVFCVSQISFDDRKLCKDQDTHLSVDCTDCRIQQKGPTFASHKFKAKSALRYEVALGILSGEIKWLNGPYPCKDWPDINIFRDGLMKELELGERVEADDGYVGERPYLTKCLLRC